MEEQTIHKNTTNQNNNHTDCKSHEKNNNIGKNIISIHEESIIAPFKQKLVFETNIRGVTGYCAINETQFSDLQTQGKCIHGDIINTYLSLLVRSKIYSLKTVDTTFLTKLKNCGWHEAQKYFTSNNNQFSNWETARLIFIPIFVGDEKLGHWLNLIVDKIEDKNVLVYIADSLGKDNEFNNLKASFQNTPIAPENKNIHWIFLEGIKQEPISMDCGVFTMLIFAKFLFMKAQQKEKFCFQNLTKIQYKNISAKEFGKQGRRDIALAIKEKKLIFLVNH